MKIILPVLFTLLLSTSGISQPFNSAKGFYKAGEDFRLKNMYPEAMLSFKRAIALDKTFDSAYVALGEVFIKIGQPDSAITNFKRALEISPEMTTALLYLANQYRDVRPNYDTAIILYTQALKTDSLNKVVYYSIAWCYNAKTEYEKAIPYAVKALEIDNNYRPAYGELGHAYRRTGKFAEAIEQFKKNIAVSVIDLPIFYSGMCYTELNDKEGALRQYEELKKINEKMAASLKKKIDSMQ